MDKIISKFLDKSFKKPVTITTVPCKTLRLVLPYLGTHSLRLKKRLNKLLKEESPSGKLKMVFRTTQRMSSCFRFKDAISRSLLLRVIYEYKCPRCNSSYIGSSCRYWEKRLEKHLHMSALMGKPVKGLQPFASMLHAKDKWCVNNTRNNLCVIGKEKDWHLIRLKGSIFIYHLKPLLYTKEGNAKFFYLRNEIMVYCVIKSNLIVFVPCV